MLRAALTALLAIALIVMCLARTPGPPKIVMVTSDRCVGCTNVSAADNSILLVDVREFEPTARFDLELVDSRGRRIDGSAGPRLHLRGLPPGTYYLRLKENGILKREYAINSR